MALDKEELRKLSPKKRIEKLKEIGEERKQELEEAEDLIRKTEAELDRNQDIPNIEIPTIEPVDISAMFEAPEGLETTVSREAIEEEPAIGISYTPDVQPETFFASAYAPAAEEHIKEDPRIKVEDTIKYESAAKDADKLTGSRGLITNIKKYTMG